MIQCLECGKRNLKFNYEDFKKLKLWRLWESNPTRPHKCLTFFENSVNLAEQDFRPVGESKDTNNKNERKGI